MPSLSDQPLKPSNAAKRLGIYLPAAPVEFQTELITRGQLEELDHNPPEWLLELRKNGPHPRPVVAGRLGISISGLARGGVTEALTTDEINELRANPPGVVAGRTAGSAPITYRAKHSPRLMAIGAA